jgi:hypothetical protein
MGSIFMLEIQDTGSWEFGWAESHPRPSALKLSGSFPALQ